MRQVKFGVAFSMALVLLNSAVSFAQKDLPINPGIKDALYLIDTEQPTKAVAEMQKIVASLPTDASLLYYLGYTQIKAGDKAGAGASFDKGIQLNEKEPLNYVGKGLLNMMDKKPVEARAQFDKALSMCKSKSVAVLKGVSEAYNLDNKFSVESVSLLTKAKGLNAEDIDVPILLGDTYFIQNAGGNVGQSVSSYENALMVKVPDPKIKSHGDAKAEYKIGMVYEKAKNDEVALEDFEKSVKADPNFTSSYRELGQLYYGKKEYAKAVEAYEKYLAMTEKPETPRYQYEYAYLLFANKDYKKANDIFAKIASAPNAEAMTIQFYSKSLFEMGEFDKSRVTFEKYMKMVKPEDIKAGDYLSYAKTLQKLKQDSLAVTYMQKSYDISKDGDLILQIANTYYKLKKYPEAITAYKTLMAARKSPSAQDYFMVGMAYYNSDQLAAADTTFTKLIQMSPDKIQGYAWLANTMARIEDEKKEEGLAKPAFEKLLEVALLNPEKNKKEIIQAYGYLSYYYYSKKDIVTAKSIYEKWLLLDPTSKQAQEGVDTLKKLIEQSKSPAKAPKK
jgi:tetratricopeptide (TPR) repeat protein